MEDINSPVFAQAKIEYTKQLIDVLKIPIYEGLQSIYTDSKLTYADGYDELPNIFRKRIENVPKWNVDMIENEVDRIVRVSNCDWLEDLITAVFISHTKILASLGNNSKRVNLTIPKSSNFIHKCYINSAREIWKNPYLFDESVSSSEYQKNIKYIENLIEESIHQTIRKALPVKEILRDHFEHSDINEKSNSEIEKTKNLQKILMKEIMETRKEKEDYMNNIEQERYFDDHVDEKTIKENTKNIVINDILSDNENEVVEPYYENPDIIDNSPIVIDTPVSVEEKLNGYKGVLENKLEEEVIVKKLDNTVVNDVVNDVVVNDVVLNDVVVNDVVNDVVVNDVKNNNLNDIVIGGNNSNNDSTNNIISDDIKNISMVESISKTIQDDTNIKTVGLGKVESVVEEVKVVDDRDETMTIDNFMNDVDDLLSDDKKNNKDDFTLFNDAKEIES